MVTHSESNRNSDWLAVQCIGLFIVSLCMTNLWLPGTAVAGVPHNPTPVDQIPAAIVGKAGPLQGSNLHYYPGSDNTTGYLAVPEGDGTKGALILIHEWDGLSRRIRETADAFAAEGYVTLAVDLYQGRTGTNREENMALVRESMSDMAGIIGNLEAATTYLKQRDDVNGQVAAIGWCYGGGIALSFALGSKNHEGTAIFYGRLVDDPDKLKQINHEILGTFAGRDQGPSPDDVDRFAKALRAAGIKNDLHIYDDVRHGFWLHVERDPEINTGPALDAWNRLRAYLARTLAPRGE